MNPIYLSRLLRTGLLFCSLLLAGSAFAQQREISGNVRDNEGTPLIGATVQEAGSTSGTVTDFDGNFSISVSGNDAVLTFTYTGYKTIRETVGTRNTINVILASDAQVLDQIVVVGYGSQKRSDITGSVSSVSAEDLEKAIFTDVDQLLHRAAAPGCR